jgi:hypothetical protein
MFEKIAERKIREAMERGEFDDLPGKGEPIDLSDYFSVPEDLRVGYSLLKQNGFVPDEVRLLREIEAARAQMEACDDAGRARALARLVNDKQLHLDMLRERAQRRRR